MAKDFSAVPCTVTIKNVGTEPTSFRYYRVNFVEVIEPEDEVIITVQTSEEYAYYAALADEKVGLEVSAE